MVLVDVIIVMADVIMGMVRRQALNQPVDGGLGGPTTGLFQHFCDSARAITGLSQ